jgi:mRNA interferase RelE/StbE
VASYKVLIKPSAVKELKRVPLKARRRLTAKIRALAEEPRPPGGEKLSGQERYRLRQGDYRAIYGIDDAGQTVIVVKVGHRGDVYRE